jgi:small multidrug resistance pump
MHWFFLGLAILAEVIGTTALKASDGMTRLGPAAIVVIGYGIAFYCLSLSLRVLPVGIAYAIWAAIGTALIAVSGYLVYGERLDGWAIGGITLIIIGVVLLSAVSKSTPHY